MMSASEEPGAQSDCSKNPPFKLVAPGIKTEQAFFLLC